MAKKTKSKKKSSKRKIEPYDHPDADRANNPPVGLVTPETDPDQCMKKTYAYDPHLDPQLVWAGKAEYTSFEVPTVSLHVHERIRPQTILQAVKTKNGTEQEPGLWDQPRPLREDIQFYQHRDHWSNRLIAGDSLLVMNSLLEKEGMAGKVQMVYIDPPYGIRYGSNFQPFVNKRDVKDGKDEDLTQEPETLKAFRDTWELGIHSYLTYLRDRLLLARELLTDSGSVFVQISDENIHHVRQLMDEVLGADNLFAIIPFKTKIPLRTSGLAGICDYLIWYAKDKSKIKFRKLYTQRNDGAGTEFTLIEQEDGSHRRMRGEDAAAKGNERVFRRLDLSSAGLTPSCVFPVEFAGSTYHPTQGKSWKTNQAGMDKLIVANRLLVLGGKLYYKLFFNDYPVLEMANIWNDTAGGFTDTKRFVVETNPVVVQRCMLMATDPGDLVFDPTCGSGTTAYVAERWGRRWITCDTSRVATTLAKQRLMSATFDFFELAHPTEGVSSGFVYETVPHVTLGKIANNPDIKEGMSRAEIDKAITKHAPHETLCDKPKKDPKKARITGPFTVEAVPAQAFGVPEVKNIEQIEWEAQGRLPEMPDGDTLQPDASVTRTGETARQSQWREELLKTGIRALGGQHITFNRVELLGPTTFLHADAEVKAGAEEGARAVISFGPEHAPMEQRQVARAIEESQKLVPKPGMIVFAAFHFDPEAAKDIDEMDYPGVTLIKAQMNGDLLTDDLKKKRSSNESFWLIGQPDVMVSNTDDGYTVEVHGFDYYNPKKGTVEPGGTERIACWMLDTNYDGRAVYPQQVFFPMSGAKDGWSRLAKNLKAEIDEELIESYRGTVSLPFEAGSEKRIAVKIVDDRGIESLAIRTLDGV